MQRDDWMKASKRKRNESTLRQRRFWEHQICDERDYEMHLNYLHYSPVKHGLVKSVNNWPRLIFHRYVQEGVYGQDWDNKGAAVVGERLGE